MQKLVPVVSIIFTLLLSYAETSFAQSLELDNSFSGDGKVLSSLSFSTSGGNVIIQDDGKILVCGTGTNGSDNIVLMRYNTNGTLDNTFDSDGIVITDYLGFDNSAKAIMLQPDGKIIIAGQSFDGSGTAIMLIRYHANGTLDNTFDSDGIVITDLSADDNAANSIALQPDGKIIIGVEHIGTVVVPGDFIVIRYNADGTIDTSFDSDGMTITDLDGENNVCKAVSIQPDGKIIAAGASFVTPGVNQCNLIRLNPDGSLDNTFDADGKASSNLGSDLIAVSSMALQPDGKIVLGGYSDATGEIGFMLARYNSDGSADNTFDSDGFVLTPIDDQTSICNDVKLQNDGKIVAVGFYTSGGLTKPLMARYNQNGSLDYEFDFDGTATPSLTTYNDLAVKFGIQSDGKFIIAGQTGVSGNYDLFVARYQVFIDAGVAKNETMLMAVFPNPVSEQFTVQLTKESKDVSIKTVDASGKIISQIENLSGTNFSIDLSNQPTGIYILEVSNGEYIERIKVIKK